MNSPICLWFKLKLNRKLPRSCRPEAKAAAAPAAKPRLMQLYCKWPWSMRMRAGLSSSAARVSVRCEGGEPVVKTAAQAHAAGK